MTTGSPSRRPSGPASPPGRRPGPSARLLPRGAWPDHPDAEPDEPPPSRQPDTWFRRDNLAAAAKHRLYGAWEPLPFVELSALLSGWARPWWLCGGRALEAYTGVSRPHRDLDVAFFAGDLGTLRAHLGDRYHLWSAGSGTLRPVTDEYPDLHSESGQVWLREHACTPWVADLYASPGDPSCFRLDFYPDFHAPLDAVTWLREDNVRVLNPEVVLGFKARLRRGQDETDLDTALPLLSGRAVERLRLLLLALDRSHPWLARL
ncbi:MAG: hypothetical protein V9G08_10960 [Dermatophilaceae bacterium]